MVWEVSQIWRQGRGPVLEHVQVLLIGSDGFICGRINVPKELVNHDREFRHVDPKRLIWIAYVLPAVLMNVSHGSVCHAASTHLNEGISRGVRVNLRYASVDNGKPPTPVSEGFGLLRTTCTLKKIVAFHTCRLRLYSSSDKCGHCSRPRSRPSVSAT